MWTAIIFLFVAASVAAFAVFKMQKEETKARVSLYMTILGVVVAIAQLFLSLQPQSTASLSASSASNPYADRIRTRILTAQDVADVKSIIAEVWTEQQPNGLRDDNRYEPRSCVTTGYGLTWNLSYSGKQYIDTVAVFTETKTLEKIPGIGGWVTWVCLEPGINLSAEDAAKIQAAVLERESDGKTQWDYSVLDNQ